MAYLVLYVLFNDFLKTCDFRFAENGSSSKRKRAVPRKLCASPSALEFSFADNDNGCLAMDPIAVGNAVRKMMMTSQYDEQIEMVRHH